MVGGSGSGLAGGIPRSTGKKSPLTKAANKRSTLNVNASTNHNNTTHGASGSKN